MTSKPVRWQGRLAYAVPPSPCPAEEEVEAPPRRRLAVPSTPPRGEATTPSSAPRPLVDPRYRFLARFGATILSGGIAAIPMALYHYQAELGLVPQEVWFVGYILAHRWTDALPFPSLRRMSRRTGVSTQMLHRYKQSLIEKGYLTTIPRHRPSGGRTSNYYDFTGLFKALEESLQHDKRGTGWMPSVDDDGDDGDDGGKGIEASRALHPGQSALTGVNQLTMIGGGEPAVTGPTLAELPVPARQNVPPKKTPNVQTPSLEPTQTEARVPHGTPQRPSQSAEHLGPWKEALAKLAQELSPATISAWLEPLVCEPPAPNVPPGTPIRLRCASVFQLQQVNRRYRSSIERALGAPIELILTAA